MISYLYSFYLCVGINENCKYFIAALIFNNIENKHPRWTPIRVKRLDKEIICFNFRLDIGITNFSNMDEFVSVTKHMKGRESKIPIHPVRKNPNKWQLTGRWVYWASIMSNIVESMCNIVLFLIAADLFSSYENVHYVGLCN